MASYINASYWVIHLGDLWESDLGDVTLCFIAYSSPPLPALTVAHEGLAVPYPALVTPPADLPERRLQHVGQGLRLQPAPARQRDDAEDDPDAQEQGQDPSAARVVQAVLHHGWGQLLARQGLSASGWERRLSLLSSWKGAAGT